ncbi:WD-40 repeat-containing protein [Reticulomyxa filosa]|uniref:WD-40 repeat-containing protein n=1 Tax=Reticulomyxa filosa TaxID=46433 RepID=X6PCU4_RETFI|nr:WD-40 repeat-containing protein [Reticulomyxa filosa]|eukprot:ETO35903.1 WD-40 repeat-containing protein [Reticulomyxa filosa]
MVLCGILIIRYSMIVNSFVPDQKMKLFVYGMLITTNLPSNVICSSSHDSTIRFWDFKDNQQLQIFKHSDHVGGIEFSQFTGSRYLCFGSYNNTINLLDIEIPKSFHVFNGHENYVWCIDISPLQSNNENDNKINNIGVIGGNGYTICSGSTDRTTSIWDIETTKQLNIYQGHIDFINSVKYILSTNSIIQWTYTLCTCVEYSLFIKNNIFNPNAICSSSLDHTIHFWDIRSNKNALHVIKCDSIISCLKFIALEKKEKTNNVTYDCNLCYCSDKGSIHIWG